MKKLSLEKRFWPKVEISPNDNGCWNWLGSKKITGYGQFWYMGKMKKATHVAWFIHHKEWPTLHVLHRCDNPSCVNPSHLFLGSHKENMADAVSKNRFRHGINNKWAKLNPDKVTEIRSRYKPLKRTKNTGPKLAQEFGVSCHTIYRILHNKGWVLK